MAEHESTTNLENHTTNDSIKFHFLGGADEVGNVAAFLCSDYASGVTGEITYVDAGFNIAAMPIDAYE